MSDRAPTPSQPRPNRRYRRLLPTAVAVAALAAAGSTLGAPPAHASGGARPPRPRHHAHGRPSRAAVVPRVASRSGTVAPGVTSI
jgi:hypothetical protein